MNRTPSATHHIHHSAFTIQDFTPALLVLISLAALLLGSRLATPGYAGRAGEDGDRRYLVRFFAPEENAGGAYRWSHGKFGIYLYGFDGRPAIVSLRMTSPRPGGAPAPALSSPSLGADLGRLPDGPVWLRYHILAPTAPSGESALILQVAPFSSEEDPRQLGAVLTDFAVAPTAGRPPLPPPIRSLFLLSLPLIGWLLALRLGARPAISLGAGLALAVVVGWAAARPSDSGFWLPTLGWPLWPALPLALLIAAPPIAAGLRRAWGWAQARPALGWAGMALALACLLAIRAGLPAAIGLPGLLLGAWAALTLAPSPSPAPARGRGRGQILDAHASAQGSHGHREAIPPAPYRGGGRALWRRVFTGWRPDAERPHPPAPAPARGSGGGAAPDGAANPQGSQHHRETIAPSPGRGGGRGEGYIVLLGILALALFLRLYNLGGQPAGLWRDESRHGLQALLIWNDPAYRPVYVAEGADLPALLFYLMAPVVGLLGPHVWSDRLVAALVGGLTPLALFWAAAPLLGRRPALIAAALLAWASWGLSMSRWAFPATLDHLLTLTAVGLAWRGLAERGARGEPRSPLISPLQMGLAGLCAGLATYAYHTGRVAPIALALVVLLRLGLRPAAWRRALPGLLLAATVGLLTMAPLLSYIARDYDNYNRRLDQVSLLSSNYLDTHTPLGLLLDNGARYLLMWHVRGEPNGRHHMPDAPMVDPAVGLLLLLGLALALRAPRRGSTELAEVPGRLAFLAIGLAYLIPPLFSTDAPHAMRSLGMLAPTCALAGLALDEILLRPATRRRRIVAAGLLAFSMAFNVWLYFGVMRVDPAVYGKFDLVETAMGRAAQAPATSRDPDIRAVRVYIPDKLREADTVRFLSYGVPTNGYTGAALPADGPALLLLPADATPAEQAAALAALGPGAAPLGHVPHEPGTDRPIILAFGRGEAAARLATQLWP